MIKVTYYIGTFDKDTCKKELLDEEFYAVFDELFENYTLQRAQGVYTMQRTGAVIKEDSFIVTTIAEEDEVQAITELKIYNNIETLKDKLNQECILVEASRPGIIFG